MTKICKNCKENKSLEKFGTYKTKKGNIYHKSECKICLYKRHQDWVDSNRDYVSLKHRERMLDKKLKAIEYKGGCCYKCKGIFHSAVYDFHHITTKDRERYQNYLVTVGI